VRSTGSEEIAFDNICINGSTTTNDPPVLAAIEVSTIPYAEGAPAVGITSTLTVADTDDTNLESAKVEFTSAFSQSQDELLFTNQNGISGSYDNVAGDLTLTGTSSLANYRTALRSVQYINTDLSDAAPGTRTVRFTVNDGDSGSNLDQTRDIDVSTTIDPPIALTSAGYCESFETNGAGTRYASNHASDGASDVFDRLLAASPPSGYPIAISGDLDGTFAWFAEDTTSTVGGEGIIDLRTQIVTGWNDLEVSFALGNGRNSDNRFEADDYVKVGYSMDGGPFTVIGAFYGNNPSAGGLLVQDSNLNGTSGDDTGTEVPSALTTYNFSIPDTGTNLVVGIRVSSAGSEEVAFDNICITGTDIAPPVANLANPTNGATVASAVINAQGYLDVTFSDNSDLDAATITDPSGEISLSGSGVGTVSLSGSGVDQGGDTYRYSFSGDFVPGVVNVNFVAGSFADLAANTNVAESESFTVTNSPPVADTDTVERYPTSSIKIPVTTLLAGDTDPDGNTPLSVMSVTASGSGAIVTLSGTRVFYNPNGHLTGDSFTYVLKDSLGATSIGTVNVNIINDTAPSQNITSGPTFPGNGTAVLVGAGIPGRTYRVQIATSGSPMTWSNYDTTTADPTNGVMNYIDPGPLPPSRLYRFVFP